MSINYLEYLTAIKEEQSFTRAAKRLYISQPALTSAIHKLESSLGVELVNRSHTPIHLTPAGILYVQEMVKIQMQERNLASRLKNLDDPEKQFNIGIGLWRGEYWLPWLIPGIKKMFPHIHPNVLNGSFDTLEAKMLLGEIDVAFGTLNLLPDEYPSAALAREPLILVIPKALQIPELESLSSSSPEHPAVIDPQLLNGCPFIRPTPGNSYYRFLERELHHYNIQPGETLTINSPFVCYKLAEQGLGICLLPQQQITYSDSLYYCRFPEDLLYQNVYLYWSKDTNKLELIHGLIQYIKSKQEGSL